MDWHDLACAYAVLGFWAHIKGEHKEAEDHLRRSQDTFEKAGFKEGKKVSLERLLWLVVARRQYGRAPEILAEAGEGASQNIYDLVLLPPYGRAMHLQGNPGAANKAYNEALSGFEEQKADLHLARTLLYQGASLLKLNDETGAARSVARGLQLAELRNYRFLPGADQVLWEELSPLVTRKRIAVAFVEQALSASAKHAVTLAAAPVEARGTGPIKTAVVEKPASGGLSLRTFGGFEARLDGVLIDQWPRRKAKLILAALLLYPRGLSLGQMIEVLGGEEVSAAALTTIKVDVSSLRRALEPNLGKGQESRYVVTTDDRYLLTWEAVEYLDLRAFDQAMGRGDRLRESEPLEAVKAYEAGLAHYRGNLLDDGFFAKYFEAEREKYRQQVVAVLMWLSRFHQDLGDQTGAETALTRAVELAPTDEDAYIALMRHQRNVGRPERIRQIYWDCRKALKAYLGMSPSPEFEAACAAIAKGA
jgi:LuxR family maltose regulon positive regulatory protein